jgi:hypothetical protein
MIGLYIYIYVIIVANNFKYNIVIVISPLPPLLFANDVSPLTN